MSQAVIGWLIAIVVFIVAEAATVALVSVWFIGGAVCALAFGVNMPILLILIGIIYIVEILSVVLQVTYLSLIHISEPTRPY